MNRGSRPAPDLLRHAAALRPGRRPGRWFPTRQTGLGGVQQGGEGGAVRGWQSGALRLSPVIAGASDPWDFGSCFVLLCFKDKDLEFTVSPTPPLPSPHL